MRLPEPDELEPDQLELAELRRKGLLWQGRDLSAAAGTLLPTGWTVLDETLGGGWPRAALTELLGEPQRGLPLLLPLLARLSAGSGWVVWVAPPYVPYAPVLAAHGVRVERILLVRDVDAAQRLWSAEQALGSGTCSAVLLWPEARQATRLQTVQLRRLQLAADKGACPAFLFRPARAAAQASPAALRLRVQPAPLGLEAEVVRQRGARPGARCIVPLQDAAAGRVGN